MPGGYLAEGTVDCFITKRLDLNVSVTPKHAVPYPTIRYITDSLTSPLF